MRLRFRGSCRGEIGWGSRGTQLQAEPERLGASAKKRCWLGEKCRETPTRSLPYRQLPEFAASSRCSKTNKRSQTVAKSIFFVRPAGESSANAPLQDGVRCPSRSSIRIGL